MGLMPGYLAAERARNIPIYGYVCRKIQSLFIDRDKSKDRDEILKKIHKRLELIEKTNMAPL
jgi:1-acyl-sn-glycerol-3-phosphate acyltransferase